MSMQYDNYNLCFNDMQFIEVNARTCQQNALDIMKVNCVSQRSNFRFG